MLFFLWPKHDDQTSENITTPHCNITCFISKSGKVQAIRKFLMSIVRVFNFKSIEDCPPYFFSFIGMNMIFWRLMMTRFYLHVSISMKRRVSIKNMKVSALHTFFFIHNHLCFFLLKYTGYFMERSDCLAW